MTEHACVTCPQLRPGEPNIWEQAQVCAACRARLRALLERLPESYALLPAALEPGQATGPKVSGSPSWSLGVRIGPLNLLSPLGPSGPVHDPFGDQHGPLPVLVVLDQWIADWIDTRAQGEHPPVATVIEMTRWLFDRLEWACNEHPAIDEYAREMSALARTVTAVAQIDHGRGEHVGYCPSVLRDDTRCNAALRVDPYVDQIQCGHCGTQWDRRKGEWLKLRAAQSAMEAA